MQNTVNRNYCFLQVIPISCCDNDIALARPELFSGATRRMSNIKFFRIAKANTCACTHTLKKLTYKIPVTCNSDSIDANNRMLIQYSLSSI